MIELKVICDKCQLVSRKFSGYSSWDHVCGTLRKEGWDTNYISDKFTCPDCRELESEERK